MQYLIQFLDTAESFAQRNDPEKASAYWGAWGSYISEVIKSGLMVSGNGCEPPETATTVRVRDGKRQVAQGPHANSRELLSGYIVLEASSLDVALDWAARCPAAVSGSVEIRPVMPPQA